METPGPRRMNWMAGTGNVGQETNPVYPAGEVCLCHSRPSSCKAPGGAWNGGCGREVDVSRQKGRILVRRAMQSAEAPPRERRRTTSTPTEQANRRRTRDVAIQITASSTDLAMQPARSEENDEGSCWLAMVGQGRRASEVRLSAGRNGCLEERW